MKAGLVELGVDVSGFEAWDAGGAIRQAVRANPKQRLRTVLESITAACKADCDLIVLPGYTVASRHPPTEIIELSKGRTIVFECLWPRAPEASKRARRPWWSFVARDERLISSGVRQWFSSSNEVTPGGLLGAGTTELLRELREGTPRRWKVDGVAFTLLVCGETNLVRGFVDAAGARRCGLPAAVPARVERWVRGAGRVVLNPAHTWSTLPWMADKRVWLSQGGWYLHTANRHSSYARYFLDDDGQTQTKNARRSRDHVAAAWRDGHPAALTPGPTGSGYSVQTVDIP